MVKIHSFNYPKNVKHRNKHVRTMAPRNNNKELQCDDYKKADVSNWFITADSNNLLECNIEASNLSACLVEVLVNSSKTQLQN